jgi:prephenate dehydrogenase
VIETVSIVGVGLIGGSFGLALRAAGFSGRILGVSSATTIEKAVALGAIDSGATLEAAASAADILFLAAPIGIILDTIDRLPGMTKAGALVTDAGSTKRAIVDRARLQLSDVVFVGGHPMAGKEKTGVDEAESDLFRGRPWALCPARPEFLDGENARAFVRLLHGIGAKPLELDADEHDRTVALTSHLPQLISTALAATLGELPRPGELAGPAAMDFTRLALSSFSVWKDIFLTNEDAIRPALNAFVATLNDVNGCLADNRLSQVFEKARLTAEKLRGTIAR